jgi:hypothetical protein
LTAVRSGRQYRWPVDRANILRRLRAVLGWSSAAGLVVGGGVANAQPPDDVLPSEIGPGWEIERGDFCQMPSPWMVRCFVGPSGYVLVAATPVLMDSRAEAEFYATGFSAAAEASPDLADAWWVPGESPDAARSYTVATEQYVFLVTLFPLAAATAADDALLLAVARDLQTRGGGPPVSQAERDVPPELAAVLVADPPAGFRASPPIRIVEDADRYEAPGMTDRLREIFERESVSVVRTFTDGGAIVVVTLNVQPYEHLAAAELGTIKNSELAGPAVLPGVDQIENAVAFVIEPETVGVAFRRGGHFVMLQGTPQNPADAAATVDALLELANRQAALLPDGDSDPYFFPSRAAAVATAIGVTTAVCLVIAGTGWVAVLRSRRRRPTAVAPSPDLVDVSPLAARRRRKSVVLTLVQIVSVNAVVVGLLFAIDGVELWSAAIVAGGVALGMLFTSWRARAELRPVGSSGARRRVLAVSGGAVATGLAAGVCLVGGTAMVANGLESLAFGPSLRRLERSVQLGISPRTISVVVALAGAALLLIGGVLLRSTRRRLRASASRVRAADRRPPVLYLRSFHDDDDLRLATMATPRRPFFEVLRLRGTDPFEEALAWELVAHGPVVAVGRPGRSLASLGAARDHLPDDQWRDGVSERMAEAASIVIVIAATDGLAWEVGEVARDGHLGKTVFVFPPTSDEELRRRWQFVDGVLNGLDMRNAPFPTDTADPLTANLLPSGFWHLTVASYRDEASYCAAIDSVMSVATGTARRAPPPEVEVSTTGAPNVT